MASPRPPQNAAKGPAGHTDTFHTTTRAAYARFQRRLRRPAAQITVCAFGQKYACDARCRPSEEKGSPRSGTGERPTPAPPPLQHAWPPPTGHRCSRAAVSPPVPGEIRAGPAPAPGRCRGLCTPVCNHPPVTLTTTMARSQKGKNPPAPRCRDVAALPF